MDRTEGRYDISDSTGHCVGCLLLGNREDATETNPQGLEERRELRWGDPMTIDTVLALAMAGSIHRIAMAVRREVIARRAMKRILEG